MLMCKYDPNVFHLPLAAALDLQAGERVRWQLLAVANCADPPGTVPNQKTLKKVVRGFSAESNYGLTPLMNKPRTV